MDTIDFAALSQKTLDEFSALDDLQLNWKPAPGSWSIGQCLDHLLRTNRSYVSILEAVLKPGHTPSFWERHSPFTDSIGKSMIHQLGRDVNRRFKAPLLFQPSRNDLPGSIIQQAAEQFNRLAGLVRELDRQDAMEKVVRSPVSPLITIRAGALLRSMSGHADRHLEQAARVAAHADFPKEQAPLSGRSF